MGTRARGIGLVILIIVGTCKLAGAADWSIVPTISQRSEFNSNLNMSPTNILSDYILSVTPVVDFNYTTEIAQLQGHLGLLGQHYITHDDVDHIDQNYQINGRYQPTPRVNLSLNSSYTNDPTEPRLPLTLQLHYPKPLGRSAANLLLESLFEISLT